MLQYRNTVVIFTDSPDYQELYRQVATILHNDGCMWCSGRPLLNEYSTSTCYRVLYIDMHGQVSYTAQSTRAIQETIKHVRRNYSNYRRITATKLIQENPDYELRSSN